MVSKFRKQNDLFPKEYIGKAKNGDEIEYEIIDNEKNVGKVTKVINERPLYCLVNHIWQGKYVLKDIDENSKEQYYINCSNYQLNKFDLVRLEQNTITKIMVIIILREKSII